MKQNVSLNRTNNQILIVIVFLINPFLSLLVAMKDYYSGYLKNIIWMFCAFYGFTFFPVGTTMDSHSHMLKFAELADQPNLTIRMFMSQFYSLDSGVADVFLPMIQYAVSRFTDSSSVFYGVLGLLFGYFFSRNVGFLMDYIKNEKLHKYGILIIIAFAFVIGPWEINSFRFWLAAHMFVFFVFKGIVQKRHQFLLGIFITPFIHFGFFFVVILFLIYKLIGNRIKLYYLMLFASLFFNGLTSSDISSITPNTSVEVFDARITGYTSESYIEERAEGAASINWYVSFRITVFYYFTIFIAFWIAFKNRKEILKNEFLPLLSLAIFMMAISLALMNMIPTFFRYLRISMLLFYGFLFLFLIRHQKWYKNLYAIHIFVVLFFAVVELRILFDSATIDTFISNPIIATFYQSYQPMINFIK